MVLVPKIYIFFAFDPCNYV